MVMVAGAPPPVAQPFHENAERLAMAELKSR
jgi:hypothetical protein